MTQWWAASVMTGDEYEIKKKITREYPDCSIYIPRRRVIQHEKGRVVWKTEELLPGYILLGRDEPIDKEKLEGFVRVIGKVTEAEVKTLRDQENLEDEDIDMGSKIIVTDGHLAGCKGSVFENNGEKVKCKIMFKNMEINVSLLKKNVSCIQSSSSSKS